MSLRIEIKDHVPGKTFYHPGDTVKGTVHLTGCPSSNFRGIKIFVRVSGRSSVFIQGLKYHDASTPLFSPKTLVLFNGLYTASPSDVQLWGFTLTIPKYASTYGGCYGQAALTTSDLWTSSMHELPPSTDTPSDNLALE
jgi:hypothetical protein